jgi:hypothetical protein
MKLVTLLIFARNVSVSALGLWLAGAGCLLGCGSMVAAAAGHENNSANTHYGATIVAEGDACSSSEGHSCCSKKQAHKSKPVIPRADQPARGVNKPADNLSEYRLAESSTSGMTECPLAMTRAITVAKIHDSQMSASAAVTHALPAAKLGEQKLSLSNLSLMPNRGHTYLRCCTFLI